MKNKLLHILLFFMTIAATAQERHTLSGKIVANDAGVPNVYIINKATGREVSSDYDGRFMIEARPGDKIIAYNTRIIVREFSLLPDSFKENPYIISVNYNAYELEELVINKNGRLNAESLGLVPKGQIKRTVAERRLYSAGTFTVGTIIGLDPIINAISGRTKMLRRAYETEKQETVFSNIKNIYSDEDITRQYNIPKENINGFIYYLVEQQEFKDAIKQGNKQFIDFLMMNMAKKFLNLQEDGK
ncbi:hypothetical protein R1T16_11750 [Flavobacterium sp. DG1-102-2]|uniref:hypothetical protein n=1 Tax=Flavobacterium sp. DG1-102-2 TaxID=3081663 RepID=UPI00294A89E6|nr:hypothetical protein [Flavobacterium sp. DG1-102-2]MDV6169099.1 hypothetical protein [Flavobacterium sp. DG1-102-2]